MQQRAYGVQDYEQDGSATSRLEAWETAVNMMKSHPLTGVGVGAFTSAFAYFSEYKPRATHNTFFEIAAESGVISGVAWLLMICALIAGLVKATRLTRPMITYSEDGKFLFLISEAILAAVTGYAVCSIFLSLKGYEIFFLMLVMGNAVIRMTSEVAKDNNGPSPSVRAL